MNQFFYKQSYYALKKSTTSTDGGVPQTTDLFGNPIDDRWKIDDMDIPRASSRHARFLSTSISNIEPDYEIEDKVSTVSNSSLQTQIVTDIDRLEAAGFENIPV